MRKIIIATAVALGTLAAPAAAFAAPASIHPHATAVTHQYVVVAGTYTTQAKAEARLSKLSTKGFTAFAIVTRTVTTHTRYLVQDGPMVASAARSLSKQLTAKHFGNSVRRVS